MVLVCSVKTPPTPKLCSTFKPEMSMDKTENLVLMNSESEPKREFKSSKKMSMMKVAWLMMVVMRKIMENPLSSPLEAHPKKMARVKVKKRKKVKKKESKAKREIPMKSLSLLKILTMVPTLLSSRVMKTVKLISTSNTRMKRVNTSTSEDHPSNKLSSTPRLTPRTANSLVLVLPNILLTLSKKLKSSLVTPEVPLTLRIRMSMMCSNS
mmetsp:Transcript_24259/g.21395  ORF Transcript_24259/g.21395 Transcript_24259/m.21395 type:complete len:210 (+) Transcript_24259:932-1561(+)